MPPSKKPAPAVEVVATKKPASIKQIVSAHRSRFGDDSIMLMGSGGTGVKQVCPTGLGVLDHYIMGIGGLPYGRIVEIYGAESSGKTTLADAFLAGCQRDGGTAVLLETEQSYEPKWARSLGVNTDDLVFLQPDYLSGPAGALQQAESLIEKSSPERPMVLVLDSVAATQSFDEYKDGLSGKEALGVLARDWSKGLRHLNGVLAKHSACLVLVNQVRSKIGVMYGPTTTTPGGNAIKFYSSIRLETVHGKSLPDKSGRYLKVRTIKNKLCPPFRDAELKLTFDAGYDNRWSTINHAKEVGCLAKQTAVSNKAYAEAIANLGWPASNLQSTTDLPDEPAEESPDATDE